MEIAKNIWAKIIILKSRAMRTLVVGSRATRPGAIRGAIKSASAMMIIVKTMKMRRPMVIICDESSQARSSLSRERYCEKTGMKAKAIVPKIKTIRFD